MTPPPACAGMGRIVILLSRDFLKWVALADLFALPVAYYALNRWLDNYAFRTAISAWIFAGAAGLAVGVALLTIGMHCVRSAAANPAKSLRTE